MSSKKNPKKAHSTVSTNITNGKGHEGDFSGSLGFFSPKAGHFALLTVVVDKHCLRIFNVSNSSLVAEHTIDTARVTHFRWLLLSLTDDGTASSPSIPTRPKKRKKAAFQTLSSESSQTQLVGLGLTNGSILLYSPDHARVVRVLSHSSLLSSVVAIASGKNSTDLWCSTSDGFLVLWNTARNELIKTFRVDGSPYTYLAPPSRDSDNIDLLAANHAIKILTIPTPTDVHANSNEVKEKMLLTGHISTIRGLDQAGSYLASHAEGDRVINIWSLTKGNLLANVSLDATVRQITTYSEKLLAVSLSNKVTIFDLSPATSSSSKVLSITPSSTISRNPKEKKNEDMALIAAIFVPGDESQVRIASLKSGSRPVFEDVRYINETGKYIPHVFLLETASFLAGSDHSTFRPAHKRYTENSRTIAGVGNELVAEDNGFMKKPDGELEIDLAELSLGQRLTALTGTNLDDRFSDSEGEKVIINKRSKPGRPGGNEEERTSIPAQSLSRVLVQALHSDDTRLLEMCLTHSDRFVVLNTVKKLPPQLVVPLLMACVERLGRGPRAGTGKGGGTGASAQRGMGLIRWIRAVLVVHTAHLVTMPDLVTKLAGLHATITDRLALRDPLLSLSGRVDLILSQMELRYDGAIPVAKLEKRKDDRKGKAPYRYVEGDSTSGTESEENIEEEEDDEGSVEDVELGGGSDGLPESPDESEDYYEEEDDDDDDDDDGDGNDGPRLKGFIDDEANEVWSDDESSEEDMN